MWKDFDFSHIPVGLLSQVYESFSNVWNRYSRSTSIYYTPRTIARYIVDESFATLKDPSNAKILDPAAGAGIFMVLAFKRLVAETWRREGGRPDSSKIQQILYGQLSGFDINESALKLAALSLYLTAIELDANPRPPHKLRFPKPLRGKVLFYYRRDKDPKEGPVIGSLGDHVAASHIDNYDLVIGNPPWTGLGEDYSSLADKYTQVIRNVAKNRGFDEIAESYTNPDNNPDLPFIWKAMEWLRPGGTIAFSLPSRILFKQSSKGRNAREALFRAIKITGILNCSNLSDTKVWPKMGQPFCLFFAKNTIPDDNAQFYFVTPHIESYLNSKGRIRIDYTAAEPVLLEKVIEEPWLLKTLSVGTSLDVRVLRKIITQSKISISDYWHKNSLKSSTGYQTIKDETWENASALKDYPDLNKESASELFFYLDTKRLLPFKKSKLHRSRDIGCYQAPLVLLPKFMGKDLNKGKALLSLNNVVYNESYYGYSGHGHKNEEELIRYLFLIVYSRLFKFYILTTSYQFGSERRAFQKSDFDNFPFVPLENLSPNDREIIRSLSIKLAYDSRKPFEEIDEWICKVYGLDDADLEVIKDTIEIGLPFKQSRKAAETPPTKTQTDEFVKYLQKQLQTFFKTVNQSVFVNVVELDSSDFEPPWKFIEIAPSKKAETNAQNNIGILMDIANKKGASQIIINGSDGLIIGLLNQYRYWTKSRARLCGLQILRDYMDAFPLLEKHV